MGSQSTTVVVNMSGGGNMGTREWSTGLCGCCEDVGGCTCMSCIANLKHRQKEKQKNEQLCYQLHVNNKKCLVAVLVVTLFKRGSDINIFMAMLK